jgi:hypothetical protein
MRTLDRTPVYQGSPRRAGRREQALLAIRKKMGRNSERARRTIREVESERFAHAQQYGELPSIGVMERKRAAFARANLAVLRYMPLSLAAVLIMGARRTGRGVQ